MESVLELYQTRYNRAFPIVCLDEATKPLVKETVIPIPAQPGVSERVDYAVVPQRAG
ncbi:MAG: hypothetical protein KME45_08255 [Stenomitos rutilans HA7619-LM2]|jgi:hypothetical protein|nr:hypothetical protein [Stenomitos rutilans HA7619-LM2]